MKKKWGVILFIILISVSSIWTLDYIRTAESISWSGAYTSVSDGFEAMIYNPAGLYYSSTRFGLNLFGSYGARVYFNSMSTDGVLDIFDAMTATTPGNITGTIDKMLKRMPATGFDVGFDVSLLNIMTYMKFTNFSLGVGVMPKTSFSMLISKSLFNYLRYFDLSSPVTFSINASLLQYLDIFINLSTRALFLEKVIPVEAIYVGLTPHLYLPTAYVQMKNVGGTLTTVSTNSFTGLLDYHVSLQGEIISSTNIGVTKILESAGVDQNPYVGGLIQNSGTFGIGFGVDMGFLVKFNRFVRVGFAVTDLGFITFPKTSRVAVNGSSDLTTDLNNFSESRYTSFAINVANELLSDIQNNSKPGQAAAWMPNTTLRVGVALTPFQKDIFTWATDLALSDLNRILLGAPPTFNFSTGIEFKPQVRWFAMPLRLAFSYNTQANVAGLSFGAGLYLGPVEMEFAVKGIEVLIRNWGANEISFGIDFKFEF